MKSIQCICEGRGQHLPAGRGLHLPACPVAVVFRFRCPECHSRRRPEGVRHAKNCILKEYQP